MVVVAKTAEIIECGHFEVGAGTRLRQFLADGFEDANSRLFFDALREKFFRPCRSLLRGRPIACLTSMHRAILVPSDVEKRPRLRSVNDHGALALRALRFLGYAPILSFIQDIRLRFLGLPRGGL